MLSTNMCHGNNMTSMILVSYSLLSDQILNSMKMLVVIMSISGETVRGYSRMLNRYLWHEVRFEIRRAHLQSRKQAGMGVYRMINFSMKIRCYKRKSWGNCRMVHRTYSLLLASSSLGRHLTVIHLFKLLSSLSVCRVVIGFTCLILNTSRTPKTWTLFFQHRCKCYSKFQ
jgi:hypothetical protein